MKHRTLLLLLLLLLLFLPRLKTHPAGRGNTAATAAPAAGAAGAGAASLRNTAFATPKHCTAAAAAVAGDSFQPVFVPLFVK